MELTNRQRELLTLITDKVNYRGCMIGADENKNWITQAYYEHSPTSEQMQGTIDRIGKVIYYQSFHTVDNGPHLFDINYLGPDIYDHSLRFEWREPIGKGYGPNPPKCLLGENGFPSSMTKDKVGNYHMPCDSGMWITLYHPSVQGSEGCGNGQERLGGRWLRKGPNPHWRPLYHFTKDEVIEGLKIMCEEFNWEFEDGGKTCSITMY